MHILSRRGGAKWNALSLLSLLSLIMPACHPGQTDRDLRSPEITLECMRGPEGASPAYRVTLHPDGLVEYLGEYEVDIPGPQSSHADSGVLNDVVKFASGIDFFEMKNQYSEMCTDVPTAIISIQVHGTIKRVSNEYGACGHETSGPQFDLARLAAKIDAVAGTARWVRCDNDCLANLIPSGLNLNAQSTTGETPLLVAIRKKDLTRVNMLLDAGANINLADGQGITPLMEAVIKDQAAIVRELLRRDADANSKDAKGFTASQMTGDAEIMALLLRPRARRH